MFDFYNCAQEIPLVYILNSWIGISEIDIDKWHQFCVNTVVTALETSLIKTLFNPLMSRTDLLVTILPCNIFLYLFLSARFAICPTKCIRI